MLYVAITSASQQGAQRQADAPGTLTNNNHTMEMFPIALRSLGPVPFWSIKETGGLRRERNASKVT